MELVLRAIMDITAHLTSLTDIVAGILDDKRTRQADNVLWSFHDNRHPRQPNRSARMSVAQISQLPFLDLMEFEV